MKKEILAVDLDWGSSGIWELESTDHWVGVGYDGLGLPDWLESRFDFWTAWYNRHDPVSYRMDKEEVRLFYCYGMSLALDLRRFLGEDYEVRYGRRMVIELPPAATDKQPFIPMKPRKSPRPCLDEKILPAGDDL